MKSRLVCLMVAMLAIIALSTNLAWAQTSSGDISGRVVDSGGNVLAGADITLTNQLTGDVRAGKTDGSGDFVFSSVQPGTYMVTAQASGFKQYEKRDLNLSSNERLSTGTLKLEVGAVTETLTVEAAATTVQSESGERSALLDEHEISSLMTQGRDITSLLRVLPGVVKPGEGADTLGQQNAGNVNGVRSDYNTLNVDGVSGNTRGGATLDTGINQDAVAEVKVLTNNYQAEYGQAGGAIVNMVTKQGGRDFHGGVYYYGRNEALNADDWFNKQAGITKGLYRFNTIGGTVGGPIMIPKLFNTKREKLFFFYSVEHWPTKTPSATNYFMMPTQAERNGDFSKSVDNAGNPIQIMDPTKATNTCQWNSVTHTPVPGKTAGCFPGNIIPTNRINANTQALLNVLPLPNQANCVPYCLTPQGAANPGVPYNYSTRETNQQPTNQQILRVDYNINDKWRMFLRGMTTTHNSSGQSVTVEKLGFGGLADQFYDTPGQSLSLNLTYVASASLVNELSVGWAAWQEQSGFTTPAGLAHFTDAGAGYNLGQYNPSQNPLGLLPRTTWAGGSGTDTILKNFQFPIANPPSLNWDNRFPLNNFTSLYSLSDGLTKTWGRHTSKAGVFFEIDRYVQEHIGSVFDGSYSFNNSTSSPIASGFPYADTLLGNFTSYQEGNQLSNYAPLQKVLEFYLQDSWKVKPNLTLEYGVRFTYDLPTVLQPNKGAGFFPGQYNPAQVPALYYPTKNGCAAFGVTRCAALTLNGPGIKNANYIGLFVQGPGTAFPNGYQFTGTELNTAPGVPTSLRNSNGMLYAPRFGFAWDPFKDGKTSIRGGAGLFYNTREGGGTVGDYSLIAPISYNGTQSFGNASQFANNCSGCGLLPFGPQQTRVLQPNRPIESIFNTTLGIQRHTFYGTVLDVAYVGTFGRHINQQVNLDANPYLSNFNPVNADTSQGLKTFQTPSGPIQQQPALSGNFFAPILGYSSVDLRQYGGTSNYNALQAQLSRRFSKGLELGVSWTWSKTMDYVDAVDGSIANFQNPRFWNYGEAGFDRTHVVVAHWLWDVPKASRLWNNWFIKGAFDNWQYSGLAEFTSGAPQGVTISSKGGNGFPDFTGGGDGYATGTTGFSHDIVTASPIVSGSNKSIYERFNTSVFIMPTVGVVPGPNTPGLTGRNVFRGPGVDNYDMALNKNIPIKERLKLQLRAEAYNVFNHPSFTKVNTTVQFNGNTGLVTPSSSANTAGWVSADQGPRIMQLSARFTF